MAKKRQKQNRKKSGVLSYVLLLLVFLLGFSLLAYPTVSDWWNSFHQSQTIRSYAEAVSGMDDAEYDALYQAAVDYNTRILDRENVFLPSGEESAEYETLLNIGDNGIIGYISIPVINCSLPIYHDTEESVLQVAVGHVSWTSLPVGGAGTHCVLSGHRGLPSARLFTDLDKMVVGDIFTIDVLDETLTYEVDQILIVLPRETDALRIQPGEDYCTLVTCTPYGVNSHRILVRGHRIANIEEARLVRVSADSSQVEPILVAPFVAVPLLILLFGWLFADDRRRWEEIDELDL